MVLFLLLLLFLRSAAAGLVEDVRGALARNDFAGAERQASAWRRAHGITPEYLEALSWLGRAALAAGRFDRAEAWSAETRKLAVAELASRPLDAEPRLPIALGAAIEVQAQALARRGERSRAILELRADLKQYWNTSIRTRIQKNIHLLTLEGRPAPPLAVAEWLGSRPAPLPALRGRTVLLFFWAHWCGDCKEEAAVLARIGQRFPALAIIGPTQRYGYAAGGEEVPPAAELTYIDAVRAKFYSAIRNMPVPVNEENFKRYGASTTPTLVLVDPAGVVRLYHPGAMSFEDLCARIEPLLKSGGNHAASTSGQ